MWKAGFKAGMINDFIISSPRKPVFVTSSSFKALALKFKFLFQSIFGHELKTISCFLDAVKNFFCYADNNMKYFILEFSVSTRHDVTLDSICITCVVSFFQWLVMRDLSLFIQFYAATKNFKLWRFDYYNQIMPNH